MSNSDDLQKDKEGYEVEALQASGQYNTNEGSVGTVLLALNSIALGFAGSLLDSDGDSTASGVEIALLISSVVLFAVGVLGGLTYLMYCMYFFKQHAERADNIAKMIALRDIQTRRELGLVARVTEKAPTTGFWLIAMQVVLVSLGVISLTAYVIVSLT